jgi:predicted RecB family nuclease
VQAALLHGVVESCIGAAAGSPYRCAVSSEFLRVVPDPAATFAAMTTDAHAGDRPLLSAYDAKRCARRVHNEWDPTIPTAAWEVPAELQLRFDAGREFEEVVLAELRAALGPERYVDLTGRRGAEAAAATVAAMERGVEVIIGGRLPDDPAGGRKGRPDLLLRHTGGYVPGEVKGHQIAARSRKGELTHSPLAEPAQLSPMPGWAVRTSRLDDHLQLAHYWRMLEAAGHAADVAPTGAVVGTNEFDVAPRAMVWLDLVKPQFSTYSRSRGSAQRSALERYDHEHGFRVEVAAVSAAGEAPLVEPVFTDECDGCPWLDHCRALVPDDTASAEIRSGRLSVREWRALADRGVTTVDELAGLDTAAEEFRAAYLPEVTHLTDPLGRLADAVRRARMLRAGVTLERETSGPIDVTRADVEIDLDIEWDTDDRVYLWGALVHRPGAEPAYHPSVAWDAADDQDSVDLAAEFASWLRSEIETADAAGQSLLVYHYSTPEPRYLKRLLGETAVADLLDRFVDLLPIVRQHFFGLHGHGIKKVAPAFGFTWRDDDPGGLQSQLWLLDARRATDPDARDAGRARILAYNEDDVRATAAIRRGL